MIKICRNCLQEKEVTDFYMKNGNPNSQCKDCIKFKVSKYRDKNKELNKEKNQIYFKKYREEHKERLNEYDRLNYINNKELIKNRSKEYYNSNRDERNKKNCERQKNNRDERNKYIRNYNKSKRINDPLFRLSSNIRTSIYNSIKRCGYTKNSNTPLILCCDYDIFLKHIESKFEDWMTWDNYGLYNGDLNYGWDLDHIIPISSANSEEEIIKLNHYTNFQPLCSKINRDIKKHKLEYEN